MLSTNCAFYSYDQCILYIEIINRGWIYMLKTISKIYFQNTIMHC